MGIGPINRIDRSVSVASDSDAPVATLREIVAAIRGLNSSELLGQERELRSRRNRNGRLVIELIDRETGETLGELPPEEVMWMAEELQRKSRIGDL